MKTQLLGAVGLLCLIATGASAQSRTAPGGPCLFVDAVPHAGFNGAMEGGPGTTVPGPGPNASVTASGYVQGFQSSACSATVGLLETGMTEPGGRRMRARLQNTDGPPGGS